MSLAPACTQASWQWMGVSPRKLHCCIHQAALQNSYWFHWNDLLNLFFQKLVREQSYQLSGTAPYLWKRVPRLATVSMGQATTLKYQCYLSFMDCFSPGSQKKGYFWLIQNKSRMNRRVAVVRDNCLIHLLVGYLQNMSAEYRQLHFFILIQPSCLYEEKTNWYKWNRSFSFRLTSIPSFHIAAK